MCPVEYGQGTKGLQVRTIPRYPHEPIRPVGGIARHESERQDDPSGRVRARGDRRHCDDHGSMRAGRLCLHFTSDAGAERRSSEWARPDGIPAADTDLLRHAGNVHRAAAPIRASARVRSGTWPRSSPQRRPGGRGGARPRLGLGRDGLGGRRLAGSSGAQPRRHDLRPRAPGARFVRRQHRGGLRPRDVDPHGRLDAGAGRSTDGVRPPGASRGIPATAWVSCSAVSRPTLSPTAKRGPGTESRGESRSGTDRQPGSTTR